MSVDPTLAAAAMAAASSNNKLRMLQKQKKQHQRPQHATPVPASPAAATAAAAPMSGQKRPRTENSAPAAKPSAAAAAIAAQMEAHNKRSQKKQKVSAAASSTPAQVKASTSVAVPAGGVRKLSALQQKMAAKLAGARFRWLNEKLYTCRGDEAWEYFQAHPEEFDEYHRGFGVQVQDWPSNPLDGCIAFLKQRAASLVVGDFGCGEARLAASVPNTVHSFDLVAANPRVTACNISAVPLPDSALDVAIFCLSLMGVDFLQFIREAHRTLKQGGTLLISEVRSRFEEAGLDVFVRAVCDVGFSLRRKDDKSNAMFVTLEFGKSGGAAATQNGSNKKKQKQQNKQSVEEEDAAEAGEDAEDDEQPDFKQRAGGQAAVVAPRKTGGGGHSRNKMKGKKGAAAAAGGPKAAAAGPKSAHFSHPSKKGSAPAGGADGPMLTACIYKKR